MSRRTPAPSPTISLFPFLAVLLCTMGALLVLLVLFSRSASQSQQVASTAEVEELELARDNARWRREQLEGVSQRTSDDLARARMSLASVEENTRALSDEMEQLGRQVEALEGESKAAGEGELEALEGRLTNAREALDKALEDQAKRPAAYAVIPYAGKHGTHRRPLYIECCIDGVFLQPEGIRLSPSDFEGPPGPGNPLACALRAAREQVARKSVNPGEPAVQPYPLLLVRPSGVMAYYAAREAITSWGNEFGYQLIDDDWTIAYPPPDPLLAEVENRAIEESRRRLAWLVENHPQRPQKPVRQYRASPTRGGVEENGGPSVLGDQTQFDWTEEKAAGAAAPGGAGGRGGSAFGNGRGGLGNTGGAGPSGVAGNATGQPVPGGAGGSGEGGGGPGDGRSADIAPGRPFAAGGEPGEAGGDAILSSRQGSGRFGASGFGGPGGSGAPGTSAGGLAGGGTGPSGPFGQAGQLSPNGQPGGAPGMAAAADASGSGQSPPGGGVPGEGQGDGPGGGGAAGGDRYAAGNASGFAGSQAGGQGGAGAGAAGSAGGTPSGTPGNGASGGAGGDVTMPGMLSVGGSPGGTAGGSGGGSLANSRGSNWASLETRDRPIPLTRPVHVECALNELRILDDSGRRIQTRVPVDGDTAQAVDPFVQALHAKVRAWGLAGDRMYWRPELVLSATADGQSRRDDLERLLADSGIDTRARQGKDQIVPLPPVQRASYSEPVKR